MFFYFSKNPKDWELKKSTKICSVHFFNNAKSEHPLHPSYLPTIFPGKVNVEGSAQSLQRFERQQRRLKQATNIKESTVNQETHHLNQETRLCLDAKLLNKNYTEMEQRDDFTDVQPNDYVEINIPNDVPKIAHRSITCQTDDVIYNTLDESTYFLCNLRERDGVSTAEVQVNIPYKKTAEKMCDANLPILKKDVKDFGCNPIDQDPAKLYCPGFHGISSITNDEAWSSLTGVNFSVFTFLLNILPDFESSKVNKQTKLLITFMKLKTGLSYTALGVLFNIHRTSAQRTFITILQCLSVLLKKFVFWPSKATVKATLPEAFKIHYPETRVIIDCTEVNTEVPAQVKNRVFMYSEYKHHHTVKFLVGCTPNGFVSFVSKCYGGRAGDCFITNICGLIDLIEPGDVVLADKGFPTIRTKVENKNAIFVMPPFLHNPQFSPEEVEETYSIASVRIHIERIMQRIKDFNIFSKVPIPLLPHIDEIVSVVCALVNLEKPIIQQ